MVGEVELRELLLGLRELGVGRGIAADPERDDVVVRDVGGTPVQELRLPLSEDHRAVRDRGHPHDGRRLVRIGGGGHVHPDPGLDVQTGAAARLRDLLHVGDAEQVDVGHQQSAVGDRAVDLREDERLRGQVELEEPVLAGGVVRPPDRVEAVAGPRAREAAPAARAGRRGDLRRREPPPGSVEVPSKTKLESVSTIGATVTSPEGSVLTVCAPDDSGAITRLGRLTSRERA